MYLWSNYKVEIHATCVYCIVIEQYTYSVSFFPIPSFLLYFSQQSIEVLFSYFVSDMVHFFSTYHATVVPQIPETA
jgi:hypothetical protein